MDQLALVVGLLLATVVSVGVGDRLRLPYPVVMLLLAIALTFIPGFPHLEISPELILPIFLPPLLFATAQRSSWAVFRVRWRTLLFLAVGLVVATTAVVAGAAWLMIPGIGIPAAIALGAMVAPPDPVAVESVAGRVSMPRKLTTVLQSEGLFNDAAAIVIFQAAVAATTTGTKLTSGVVMAFLVGAVVAVLVGMLMGYVTSVISRLVTALVARSAITLVVPFAAYILAEELHASGVIAVVVVALEIKRHARPEDAAERVTKTAFWDVVELLVTGLAFGLVGLEIRDVVLHEASSIPAMVGVCLVVCVLVFAVRFGWLWLLAASGRRKEQAWQPTSATEVLILTWCGMRGLATLALALALPLTLDDGRDFPFRGELIVIACAVLLATLVLPGLTLPALMKLLKASEDGSHEHLAVKELAARAQGAAVAALKSSDVITQLPPEKLKKIKESMARLRFTLEGSEPIAEADERLQRRREVMILVQTIALDAARQEVLSARNELGTDPEVADRVLRQLDLRTMLMPD